MRTEGEMGNSATTTAERDLQGSGLVSVYLRHSVCTLQHWQGYQVNII